MNAMILDRAALAHWPVRLVTRTWVGLMLFASAVLPSASHAGECPVPVVKHAVFGTTCPKVGHIGTVRIVVPQHYLFGPFTYKDVDIWDPKSFAKRPRNPTFDTQVDNFAIRISTPGFLPIQTAADSDDYLLNATSPKDGTRWLHVVFEPYDADAREASECNSRIGSMTHGRVGGPFELRGTEWGLQHYVSGQQPTEHSDQREIYYDPRTESTFISCKTRRTSTPAHELMTTCEHEFYLRDRAVHVSVMNIWSKDDLAGWREVEAGIRTFVDTFDLR